MSLPNFPGNLAELPESYRLVSASGHIAMRSDVEEYRFSSYAAALRMAYDFHSQGNTWHPPQKVED